MLQTKPTSTDTLLLKTAQGAPSATAKHGEGGDAPFAKTLDRQIEGIKKGNGISHGASKEERPGSSAGITEEGSSSVSKQGEKVSGDELAGEQQGLAQANPIDEQAPMQPGVVPPLANEWLMDRGGGSAEQGGELTEEDIAILMLQILDEKENEGEQEDDFNLLQLVAQRHDRDDKEGGSKVAEQKLDEGVRKAARGLYATLQERVGSKGESTDALQKEFIVNQIKESVGRTSTLSRLSAEELTVLRQTEGGATRDSSTSLSSTIASILKSSSASSFTGIAPNSATSAAAAPGLPAPLATVNQPLRQEGWDRAMGERVIWMARNGIKEANLQLTPRELGPLQVKVAVAGNGQEQMAQVNIQFTVQNSATREALENSMQRLHEMMEQEGFNLAQSDVSQYSDRQHAAEEGEHSDRDLAEQEEGAAELDGVSAQLQSAVVNEKEVDIFV